MFRIKAKRGTVANVGEYTYANTTDDGHCNQAVLRRSRVLLVCLDLRYSGSIDYQSTDQTVVTAVALVGIITWGM